MANTKEAILEKHAGVKGVYLTHGMIRGSEALEAMDEFAEEMAIGFLNWVKENGFEYSGSDDKFIKMTGKLFGRYTESELYKLYIETLEK